MKKHKSHTPTQLAVRPIGDGYLLLILGGVVPTDPEDPPVDPEG